MGPRLHELRAAKDPLLLVTPQRGQPDRVALVPGSFDPITIAHAALAEAASAWADLVILVYSVRTLPKEDEAEPPFLAERDRIRVLEAFCHTRPHVAVGLCSHGLLVEQVRAARRAFPHADIRLVVGSDKVFQLLDPRWYENRDTALDELFRETRILYAVRLGDREALEARLSDPGHARWRRRFEPLDVLPDVAAVSSRRVRILLRQGSDVRALVPPEALEALPAAGRGERRGGVGPAIGGKAP